MLIGSMFLYRSTAIHRHVHTSDELTVVGAQEHCGLGNVLNLTQTSQWYVGQELLAVVWGIWHTGE